MKLMNLPRFIDFTLQLSHINLKPSFSVTLNTFKVELVSTSINSTVILSALLGKTMTSSMKYLTSGRIGNGNERSSSKPLKNNHIKSVFIGNAYPQIKITYVILTNTY